jgi:hypothetical protein
MAVVFEVFDVIEVEFFCICLIWIKIGVFVVSDDPLGRSTPIKFDNTLDFPLEVSPSNTMTGSATYCPRPAVVHSSIKSFEWSSIHDVDGEEEEAGGGDDDDETASVVVMVVVVMVHSQFSFHCQ